MLDPTTFRLTVSACVLHERAELCRYVGHTFAVTADGDVTLATIRYPDSAAADRIEGDIDRLLDALYTRGEPIPPHLLA